MYDEQIVDKIKIIKVHTFNTTTRETDWIAKSVIPKLGKIPHTHWVNGAKDLSTYVSQVAEAEVRSIGRSKP